MDVLLTGGQSFLMDALIAKLNKEGHRVFVLSGNKYNSEKYKKVFEQYDFSYDTESLQEVVESINPDAVIFTGAYDTNFRGKDVSKRESVTYTTGLINLLMALSTLPKNVRFLYLSHEAVFETTHTKDIPETTNVSPQGAWELAVRQGEITCENYQASTGVDAVVLRLDHLYGLPRGKADLVSPLYDMCREGLSGGKVTAHRNRRLSLLHVSDAVEYIFRVLAADEHKEKLYHLSSGNVYLETEVAEMVAAGLGKNVSVEKTDFGQPFRVVLSNKRFFDEFGGKVFDDPSVSLAAVADYVRRNKKQFFQREETKNYGTEFLNRAMALFDVLVPYFETAIAFIPFFMLNNRATGSAYFANLDFYLLYVLIFAIIFGQQQATLAAILSTAGYIFRQQYDRSGFDVIVDYNTYVWIAQLFILGLAVGYMRDRLRDIKGEDESEMEYLSGQLNDISDINTANVHIKGVLETQIINQNDSFGRIYEITSALDQYEPEEVLFYAAEVVAKLNHSEDVAIYSVSNRDYARLFAATSAQARIYGNSLKYRELTAMIAELEKNRVFINKTMDEKYPLMANAIFSGEEIDLIIMVWGIPWDRMNLSQANMLRVTGYLIQNAVVRANRYMQALENERYQGGTNVLAVDAFTTLLKAYLNAMKKDLTEACILQPDIGGKTVEEAGNDIVKILRNTDYLGQLADGNLYILLSNTNTENASFVTERLQKIGYPAVIREGMTL